ncbi:MAG TPA: hypothetical protein VES40_16450, partial [Ilumatobacteraceae bacterium]|nr:hypothetical protein [Ilumatobacteraceae bacterium]
YIPDDPRLRTHAFEIAEARRHILRPLGSGDDGDDFAIDGGLDDQVHPNDVAEQLTLFSVVSSTATDITVHTVTEDGVCYEPLFNLTVARYDDDVEIPEPSFMADPSLNLDLPEVPTAAGLVPSGSLSVAERKDDLRTRNAHVAKRLVDITGWGHARVQGEMNKLAGVTRVATATTDQLERRLRYSESWLRRLQR